MTQFISFFMKHAVFDSKDVAKVIYKTICKKDPNLRIHGTPDAFFFYYLRRILPARLFLRLLYCMLPKRKDWVRKWSSTLRIGAICCFDWCSVAFFWFGVWTLVAGWNHPEIYAGLGDLQTTYFNSLWFDFIDRSFVYSTRV